MFRTRSFEDKSFDAQVMIKTFTWFFTFFFCVALYRFWVSKLTRIDNFFQVLFLLLAFISCFYAPDLFYSLASVFSLISIMLLFMLSSSILDNREIIRQFILGGTLVAVISILVYFIYPEFGRAKIWVGPRQVPSPRLSGITGSANTIGYISAVCLLNLYYYRRYLQRTTITFWLFVAIDMMALLMSNSRTSMLALVLSILVAGLAKPTPARLVILSLSIVFPIVLAFTVDFDSLLPLLTRSGDASEITTGTGRTAIWSAVIGLIMQRPLFGWGYASSNTLLPAMHGTIGFTINHAHNALLQVALSLGLVGALLFVILLSIKIFYSFKSREQLNIALMTFLFIDGITESVAFQGVASTTTIMLAMVLSLNYYQYRVDVAGRRITNASTTQTGKPSSPPVEQKIESK